MKKTTIILLLSILFSGHIFAQRTFYIRPKIEEKSYQTTTNFFNFTKSSLFNKNLSFDLISNPYTEVSVSPISFLTVYNIGFNAGVVFSYGDLLEVGWNQDATSTRFNSFTPISPANDNRYGGFRNEFASLIFNNRFELLYYKRRKVRDQKRLHLQNSYYILGSGFKYNGNALNQDDPSPEFDDYFLAGGGDYDDISINIEHRVNAINKFSMFLSLGLSSDIYFNEKYLFSSSLIYTQGFKTIESTTHKVIVEQTGVPTKEYVYHTFSRGSGFQFQISRRLQFYPWKKRKIKE